MAVDLDPDNAPVVRVDDIDAMLESVEVEIHLGPAVDPEPESDQPDTTVALVPEPAPEPEPDPVPEPEPALEPPLPMPNTASMAEVDAFLDDLDLGEEATPRFIVPSTDDNLDDLEGLLSAFD